MFEVLSKADLPFPYRDFSNRHMRRLVKDGKFPVPMRVGRHDIWPKSVVEEHMASLAQTAGTLKHQGSCFTPETGRAAIEKRWAERRAQRAGGTEAA